MNHIKLNWHFANAMGSVIERASGRAEDAKTEIRAMAESASRSIGQKVRYAKRQPGIPVEVPGQMGVREGQPERAGGLPETLASASW